MKQIKFIFIVVLGLLCANQAIAAKKSACISKVVDGRLTSSCTKKCAGGTDSPKAGCSAKTVTRLKSSNAGSCDRSMSTSACLVRLRSARAAAGKSATAALNRRKALVTAYNSAQKGHAVALRAVHHWGWARGKHNWFTSTAAGRKYVIDWANARLRNETPANGWAYIYHREVRANFIALNAAIAKLDSAGAAYKSGYLQNTTLYHQQATNFNNYNNAMKNLTAAQRNARVTGSSNAANAAAIAQQHLQQKVKRKCKRGANGKCLPGR